MGGRYHIKDSIDQLPDSSADAYDLFHIRKYEQLILVCLYLAQSEAEEALCLLEALQPKFVKIGRMPQVIEIKILRALALDVLGKMDEALAEAGKCLDAG